MRLIDAQFLETPWYGSRQMAMHLCRGGYEVGRKRVRRLMATMGLMAIYQRPRTTVPHPEHRIYPNLLRGMLRVGLLRWIGYYARRPHSTLGGRAPDEAYRAIGMEKLAA
jgi:transposase InsO family protein